MRNKHALWILSIVVAFGCSDPSSTIESGSPSTAPNLDNIVYEFNLNRDWRARDKILDIAVRWGKEDSGGIVHVDHIDMSTLQRLLSDNFIDSNDQQNEAPTVAEIAEFMRAHPGSYAFGYAVSPTRPDYRVSLEGVAIPTELVTPAVREAAEKLCHDADEATFEPEVYCWWD